MAVVVSWVEEGLVLPTVCFRGSVPVWINGGVSLLPFMSSCESYRLDLSRNVYDRLSEMAKHLLVDVSSLLRDVSAFLVTLGGELVEIVGPDQQSLLILNSSGMNIKRLKWLGVMGMVFVGAFSWMVWFERSLHELESQFSNQELLLRQELMTDRSLYPISDLDILLTELNDWPVGVQQVSVVAGFFRVLGHVSYESVWELRDSIRRWESDSSLVSSSRFSILSETELLWEFMIQL